MPEKKVSKGKVEKVMKDYKDGKLDNKKIEKPVKLGIKVPGKPAREVHTIKKNKQGEVIVDHAKRGGAYDKINLTKKAGAKTIAQGVKATKDWHKKNG
jgi:hypothetical protein